MQWNTELFYKLGSYLKILILDSELLLDKQITT